MIHWLPTPVIHHCGGPVRVRMDDTRIPVVWIALCPQCASTAMGPTREWVLHVMAGLQREEKDECDSGTT